MVVRSHTHTHHKQLPASRGSAHFVRGISASNSSTSCGRDARGVEGRAVSLYFSLRALIKAEATDAGRTRAAIALSLVLFQLLLRDCL